MKEWSKVSHSAHGVTVVTVTLLDGNLSAKWSTKTFIGDVQAAYRTARAYALRALNDLQTVVALVEQEESG